MFLALALFGCSNTVPADQGAEDSFLEFSGGRIDCIEGSTCDPRWVPFLPHEDANDVSEATNAIIGYDCHDGDWTGNEVVYAFNVQTPGTLEVLLDATDELNAFVVARDQRYACTAQGSEITSEVLPGRYWLVVDSTDEATDTSYELLIDFTEITDADIIDEYEPNDTPSQAPEFDVGWEETWEEDVNLTPSSRVDYYRIVLTPCAEFNFSLSDENLEVEIVEWEGPDEPVMSVSEDGDHYFEMWDWSGDYETEASILIKVKAKDDLEIPAEGYDYTFTMAHDFTA